MEMNHSIDKLFNARLQNQIMSVVVGQKAPNFGVSEWIQGMPTNFDQEKDHIVLLEVFQVNCPGCFMHSIPEAIQVYQKYSDRGVRVIGLATAFEDFELNTAENLRMLAETGEVIGETKKMLAAYGQLVDGFKYAHKIPFPLAMDNLAKAQEEPSHEQIMQVIRPQIPDFESQPPEYQNQIIQKAKEYLSSKEYSAETFEKFGLRGTPSTILVDRNGILRHVSFGQSGHLDATISKLLEED